jgi:hypothetical protein
MSDYHIILDGLSGLFDYITGGACSKENTDKAVIKMLFDQHIEKLVEERVKEEIEALAQDHSFDRTASHMAGEYVDTNWDTSDMAHRTGGLSMEQEPVNEHDKVDLRCECCGYMTYHREHLGCIRAAAPPSKPWVSLTAEEIYNCWQSAVDENGFTKRKVYDAIEAKLKEKNT